MKDFSGVKSLLFKYMLENLDAKADDAEHAIASAKESRNNDTKSSAGDKYETGRAMMQMEIDNNEMQLSKTRIQQEELFKIDLTRKYDQVSPGSLVITTNENYFISIAMGKISVSENNFYAISLASPIGMLLNHKKAGDKVSFQGKDIVILQIL